MRFGLRPAPFELLLGRTAGAEPLDFFDRPTDEPSVFGWMPAASVFFRDPDGHLLEYLAMLPHEARPEAGVVPYGEWTVRWARPAPTDPPHAGGASLSVSDR